MQTVFICNPYSRENDRVSRWILDHYLLKEAAKPAVLLGAIYLRWYNYIPTMRLLIDLDVPQRMYGKPATKALNESVESLVDLRDNHGCQLFGGAYIIRPIVDGEKGARKVESIAQMMIRMANDETLYKEISGKCQSAFYMEPRKYLALGSTTTEGAPGSMAYAFARLQSFSGMGKFYCYQFIGDLAYTHVLKDAPDWWDWSFVGPGTARGLVRLTCPSGKATLANGDILPRMMKYTKDMAQQLHDLRKQVNKDLRLTMSPANQKQARSGLEIRGMVPIHMRNLTGCLCEFDKYERALFNERSIKRPYYGTGN
jgi:hypothetical protein